MKQSLGCSRHLHSIWDHTSSYIISSTRDDLSCNQESIQHFDVEKSISGISTTCTIESSCLYSRVNGMRTFYCLITLLHIYAPSKHWFYSFGSFFPTATPSSSIYPANSVWEHYKTVIIITNWIVMKRKVTWFYVWLLCASRRLFSYKFNVSPRTECAASN